jgi:hypothetical protein
MLILVALTQLALGQAPPPADPAPVVPSIWSAVPLRGGSVATAWAGWASLGLAYAQGVTDLDDLGGALDLDWATTELRLGAFYRRPLAGAGGWDLGARVGVGWYAGFGGQWVRDANRSDRGIELDPALTFSRPASGGLFSGAVELPFTFTFRRGGGMIFRPRLVFGYETGLWRDLAVGVRAGVGWRGGAGEPPLPQGRGDLLFVATATYRVF